MSSLKHKTISGVIWSAIDSFAGQGISFVVGVVLARLLSPEEFGLIGMITIFISISESFINSGFSQALIRKKDVTEIDYSTVFYFNLTAGILFFIILFFSAPLIASFFHEPELDPIVKVLSIVLIINSLSAIQKTILTKRINFKLQTKISLIASTVAGIIAIAMAYYGYGVWSLVFKTLIQQTITSILYWTWNKWYPILTFSINSFKELFSFGSKLLISGLIFTIYRNIYFLIIGKYFSAKELGLYTRARLYNDLLVDNIHSVISRVTFPVLAEMQDDKVRLKAMYKKIIKVSMMISSVLMAGLAASAEPLIISLIGEQWRQSIIYLQLLTFVGVWYPLHAINLNMLQVLGRSDLFLKLEIIKVLINIPTLIIGILFGIKFMILSMWVTSIIAYYLNSYWSGKFINYSMAEQVLDIIPGFIVAILMGTAVFFIGKLTPIPYLLKLILQMVSGGVLTLIICEFFKPEAYIDLKQIIIERFLPKLKNNK